METHIKVPLYPNEELRNKLAKLGVPRYRHNLAELGEMLPVSINLPSGENVGYCCVKTIHKYICGYDTSENIWARLNDSEHHMVEIAETEADARAMLLIYLIETNL